MFTVEAIWNIISSKVEQYHIIGPVSVLCLCVHKSEAVCSFITVCILMPEIISGRISAHRHPFSRLSNATRNEMYLFHRQPCRSSGAAADYRERESRWANHSTWRCWEKREKERERRGDHPPGGFRISRGPDAQLHSVTLCAASSWTLRNWPPPLPPTPSHPPTQRPQAANWENGGGMGWGGGW